MRAHDQGQTRSQHSLSGVELRCAGVAWGGNIITENTFSSSGDGQEVIIYGSSGDDEITGTQYSDLIVGGAGDDTLSGGAAADTLTGGEDADTFVYLDLSDSLAGSFDTITDFSGEDFFMVSEVAEAAINEEGGLVALGDFPGEAENTLAEDIAAAFALNEENGEASMANNGAATVTITGDNAGSYLIMNDGIGGFDASFDAVIQLTDGFSSVAQENFIA